jgi:hypothetical protein
MFPENWEKKLVDLNVRSITDEEIKWADYVFISAMSVQRDSANSVIEYPHSLPRKIVAGAALYSFM